MSKSLVCFDILSLCKRLLHIVIFLVGQGTWRGWGENRQGGLHRQPRRLQTAGRQRIPYAHLFQVKKTLRK
mgnify:CR=1 FL=1